VARQRSTRRWRRCATSRCCSYSGLERLPARLGLARALGLLAAGLTNAEIASRLVLSEHTVHRHVANILVKLGARSRAAAAVTAAERGLL
jgi:DNA-binding CsgD family transcriptional regulator